MPNSGNQAPEHLAGRQSSPLLALALGASKQLTGRSKYRQGFRESELQNLAFGQNPMADNLFLKTASTGSLKLVITITSGWELDLNACTSTSPVT